MTDEQIVEAAKSAEKKTGFGVLVHSKVSQGINSAYGIGFLEGAEWARKQMIKGSVETNVIATKCGDKYQQLLIADWNGFNDLLNADKVRVVVLKKEEKK